MQEVNGSTGPDLIRVLRERLADLSLTTRVDDSRSVASGVWEASTRLQRNDSGQNYRLIFGPAVTLSDLAGVGEQPVPTLVFTRQISPKTADSFRRGAIQYLD